MAMILPFTTTTIPPNTNYSRPENNSADGLRADDASLARELRDKKARRSVEDQQDNDFSTLMGTLLSGKVQPDPEQSHTTAELKASGETSTDEINPAVPASSTSMEAAIAAEAAGERLAMQSAPAPTVPALSVSTAPATDMAATASAEVIDSQLSLQGSEDNTAAPVPVSSETTATSAKDIASIITDVSSNTAQQEPLIAVPQPEFSGLQTISELPVSETGPQQIIPDYQDQIQTPSTLFAPAPVRESMTPEAQEIAKLLERLADTKPVSGAPENPTPSSEVQITPPVVSLNVSKPKSNTEKLVELVPGPEDFQSSEILSSERLAERPRDDLNVPPEPVDLRDQTRLATGTQQPGFAADALGQFWTAHQSGRNSAAKAGSTDTSVAGVSAASKAGSPQTVAQPSGVMASGIAVTGQELASTLTTELRQPLSAQVSRVILEHIERQGAPDQETMTIRLDPPELGEMVIELSRSKEGLAIRVTAREAVTMDMLLSRGREIETHLRDERSDLRSLEFLSEDMMRNSGSQGQFSQNTSSQRAQEQASGRTSSRTASSRTEPAGKSSGTPPVSRYDMSFRA